MVYTWSLDSCCLPKSIEWAISIKFYINMTLRRSHTHILRLPWASIFSFYHVIFHFRLFILSHHNGYKQFIWTLDFGHMTHQFFYFNYTHSISPLFLQHTLIYDFIGLRPLISTTAHILFSSYLPHLSLQLTRMCIYLLGAWV